MHGHGGYDSDFSDDEHGGESNKRKKRTIEDDILLKKPFQKEKHGKVAHKQVAAELLDREEARNRRFHLIAMDATVARYTNCYYWPSILLLGILENGREAKQDLKCFWVFITTVRIKRRRQWENDKTDMDVIRENHRFLWNEEDEMDMNWEKKLAKKYYDKLFKEYCIADLSRYKENKFGFRWRIEKEVISGKGQFFCGNKCCDKREDLKSWEVNFGYVEHGEKRNALVKLRHSSSKKSEKSVNRNSDEEEGTSESELWKGPLPETDEKSQEEEFDDYFQDLFL
ncbi:protein FRA10AC1 isoform X3 [Zalophus californianus]|uniref:Protein FRA10AC1 isoform X3 n=1 Tax=Zalophus californianus TaxID=9704 RepID=A0A6J2D9R1_ZALCA|nr:protein FRA10AC1 isoform X3 [Zalophus californianus]XP_027954650.1 protein FRA10AC1 isoform X3 [Eumetopias jubatus]